MKFTPEKCKIPDEPMKPFIDAEELEKHLQRPAPSPERVDEIIKKSLNKQRLYLDETADLLNAEDEKSIEKIKAGARKLKETVYGNRIVLFAPLYIGNKCVNNCRYCGFRTSNTD